MFLAPKQAPLPFAVKPIRVKDIWSKDENFGWSQGLAIGLHVAVIALLVIPISRMSCPLPRKQRTR